MPTKNPNIIPGWKMTKTQIYGDGRNGSQPGYFEMFRQICQVKGWKGTSAQMTDYRYDWHELAGLGRCSAKDIDRMRGFDALKAIWLAITRPADLNAQLATADQPRHRLITRIRSMAHPDYIQALLESSRFKATALEDLDETQLEHFRNTLDARIRSSREDMPAKSAEVAEEPEPEEADCPF